MGRGLEKHFGSLNEISLRKTTEMAPWLSEIQGYTAIIKLVEIFVTCVMLYEKGRC